MSNIYEAEQAIGAPLSHYGLNESKWNALSSSIFPGAKPESIILAVEYCKARNLDVMKKPCHIVPMSVKNAKTGQFEWRDVIMPSITEIRITASRTGQYAGQDAPVFGDMIEMRFGQKTITAPESCTVTVYRIVHGEKVAFSHTEYFEEACATTNGGSVNSMWSKRKRGQLSKCAEAGALRKAFPEEIGNEYTKEEMEGKIIDVGGSESIQDTGKVIELNAPAGYKAFEDEYLPMLQLEAQYGIERLKAARKTIPNNELKPALWANHAEDLKAVAEFADKSLARKGESNDNPAA